MHAPESLDVETWLSLFSSEKKKIGRELEKLCVSVLQALPQHATSETSQYICIAREWGRSPCRETDSQMAFSIVLDSRSPATRPSTRTDKCPPRDRTPPDPSTPMCNCGPRPLLLGEKAVPGGWTALDFGRPRLSPWWFFSLSCWGSHLSVSYVTWYDMLEMLTWPEHDTWSMLN